MPIDRPEFDAGDSHHPVQRQIEEFLTDHPTMAYSAEEIAVAIGHPAGSPIGGANSALTATHLLTRLAFISELDWMALEGKIERRVVRTPSGHLTFYAPKSVP